MKIGILSLTSGYNYGGTLQCLALQNTLSEQGHEVSVINYYPTRPAPVKFWRGWGLTRENPLQNIKIRLHQLFRLGSYKKQYNAFKHTHLRLTQPCYNRDDIEQIAKDMDAIVVGSDQVWNLRYHPDPNFYLKDFNRFHGLKISYAACCGCHDQKTPGWVGKALVKFDAISVRDSFTAEWVKNTTEDRISTRIAADPTMLARDYPRQDVKVPSKFIAIYLIGKGNSQAHRNVISKLREKHGNLPVVCLMPTAHQIQLWDWVDKTSWHLDPYEWIECIRRAQCLYTDSFHGVLFAMRFKTEFHAVYFEKIRAARLIEISNVFGVGHRIIDATNHKVGTIEFEPLDWKNISETAKKICDESTSFLVDFLTRTKTMA